MRELEDNHEIHLCFKQTTFVGPEYTVLTCNMYNFLLMT